MKKNWMTLALAVTLLTSAAHADQALECEKMQGTFSIAHYGQSGPARYIKYRLELTLDGPKNVAYYTNWGSNCDAGFEGDDLSYSFSWKHFPGSLVGNRTIMAVSDPEMFLSFTNEEVNHLAVVLKHLDKKQTDIASKQAALKCAKSRLTAMSGEVRKKYMQSRQVDLRQLGE